MAEQPARPLRVGDRVALIAAVPGRAFLRPGLQGTVLVVGLPGGRVSVALAAVGPHPRIWQLPARALRRLGPARPAAGGRS